MVYADFYRVKRELHTKKYELPFAALNSAELQKIILASGELHRCEGDHPQIIAAS
jgi:hypothetical protein